MNTVATWQSLRVQEFINQCNWQNIVRQTSVSSVAQHSIDFTSWPRLTASDFFALSNWSGKAVFIDGLAGSTREQIAFGLTLTSDQFWQYFNWSGEKKASTPHKIEQVLEQAQEAIAEAEGFTLNDLSQLF